MTMISKLLLEIYRSNAVFTAANMYRNWLHILPGSHLSFYRSACTTNGSCFPVLVTILHITRAVGMGTFTKLTRSSLATKLQEIVESKPLTIIYLLFLKSAINMSLEYHFMCRKALLSIIMLSLANFLIFKASLRYIMGIWADI